MNPFHVWTLIFLLLSVLAVFLGLFWLGRTTITALQRAVSMASQAAGIPTYRHSHPHIPNELARARRYQRSLTIAVLNLEQVAPAIQSDLNAEVQRAMNGNGHAKSHLGVVQHLQRRWMQNIMLSFPFIGYILRDALRESDIVTFDAMRSQYVVALPEITKSQAVAVVRRLTHAALKNSRVQLRVGFAEFPCDGLTVEDLVNISQLELEHGSVAQTTLDSAA